MNKPKKILFILLFAFNLNFLPAQEHIIFNDSRHKIGFISGYGSQYISGAVNLWEVKNIEPQLSHRYTYNVFFFQLQYYYALVRKQSWSVELLFQPQYNTAAFRYHDSLPNEELSKDWEAGLTGGILLRKNFFNDYIGVYAALCSGPEYVSAMPERQAKGFIFSDNLFLSADIRMYKNLYLDMRTGFRHLSNAGLHGRNAGVDDLIISGGVFFVINKKTVP